MTSDKKIQTIECIVDRYTREQNDDEGDKYLSQPEYAMEAIEAVLDGQPDNPILKQFLEQS